MKIQCAESSNKSLSNTFLSQTFILAYITAHPLANLCRICGPAVMMLVDGACFCLKSLDSSY
jgi:hypothetical protein